MVLFYKKFTVPNPIGKLNANQIPKNMILVTKIETECGIIYVIRSPKPNFLLYLLQYIRTKAK